MSCYTTIYPDWDYKKEFEKVDDVIAQSKSIEKEIEHCWLEISDLAFVSTSVSDIDDMQNRIEDLCLKYLDLSKQDYHLFAIQEMFDSEEDGIPPCVSVNHYAWNYSPADGVRDNKKKISDCFAQIRGYALAKPSDIVPLKDDDGYVNDPVDYITSRLKDIRSFLDESLCDYFFSKLCVEFWDTHIID